MNIQIIKERLPLGYTKITNYIKTYKPMFSFSFASTYGNTPMPIPNMYIVPMARDYKKNGVWKSMYENENLRNFYNFVEEIIEDNIEKYKKEKRKESLVIYTEAVYEVVVLICDYFSSFKYKDLFKGIIISCRE